MNNECKELLLILQKEAVSSEISIHCEHIAGNGESQHYTFTLKQEKASACPLTGQVGTYLYEPNVAILKAGAFRSLTQTYPVMKLHLSSHLYTSASLVPDFPGRRFRVESVSGFGKKGTESVLDGYGQGEYYDPQLSIIGCGTSQTFETERGRR